MKILTSATSRSFPSYSGAVQLVSKAPPRSMAQSNSFFLACFSSLVFFCLLVFVLLFSHCFVVRWLFTSPPLHLLQLHASVEEGSYLQREQETPSDSSLALIGCLTRARRILANGLRGSKWSQRSLIFFTDYLSHVLLSGHSDSFSKYN